MLLWVIGFMSIGLIGFFLLKPGAQDDFTPRPLALPDDLDAYLRDTESQYRDIVPGSSQGL